MQRSTRKELVCRESGVCAASVAARPQPHRCVRWEMAHWGRRCLGTCPSRTPFAAVTPSASGCSTFPSSGAIFRRLPRLSWRAIHCFSPLSGAMAVPVGVKFTMIDQASAEGTRSVVV